MFMKVHIEEILLNLPVWLNSENLANTALVTEGTGGFLNFFFLLYILLLWGLTM